MVKRMPTNSKARKAAPKSTKPKHTVHDIVAEKMIARIQDDLDKGVSIPPWQQEWSSTAGLPRSLTSGKPYRGINIFLLGMTAMTEGYTSPWWGTYDQIAEHCGAVEGPKNGRFKRWTNPDGTVWDGLKDEKSTLITFYSNYLANKGTDDEKKIFTLRYFLVFNSDQVHGDIKVPAIKGIRADRDPIEAAEAIVADWSNQLKDVYHKGSVACYFPGTDTIHIPVPKNFHSEAAYYTTFFHEAVHSTGAAKRLNREGIAKCNSRDIPLYSREELVAEMGAAMLCGSVGITSTMENSAAYLKHWLEVIKGDSKLLVQAAGQAQRAVDMILNVTWEADKETTS